ncbi:MAG: hypothetical protein GY796_33035, partial [Chloroflexi bacterium]|nr:hypothetical protein [Chloroflexota bacterium]
MKTIEQINADIENIQRLLVTHNDRLQVLREQQAQFGIHCPPHIVTEIKQIETEMEALDTQLQQLNQEKEYLAAPVVVMANFAPLPSNLPPKRVEFDWSD